MRFVVTKFLYAIWKLLSFIPLVIVNILYHPLARKLSWKNLPNKAKKLGLHYIKSNNTSEFGELSGVFKGHNVTIKPDENGKVIAFFKTVKPLQLWTEKYREQPNRKMQIFKTSNWVFNFLFKTRRASKEFAQTINSSHSITDRFVRFYLDWIWTLSSIYVSDRAIYCEFNYGHPFFPYFPASSLEKIINDIIGLADQIDSLN